MMQKMANSGYRGLPYYRAKGYIPADKEEESVSKTFEYCYDDWASAHVAKKLGKTEDAAMLSKRSTNFKNYYDPTTQFMRPKLDDGKFTDPFNPIDMGHTEKWRDYTESNAWQTTFGVQHDPAGLIELFGGREPFLTKLDLLFTVPSTLPANAPPDIAGMVGQYAHGNEPSHHIALSLRVRGRAVEDAVARADAAGDDVLTEPRWHAGQRGRGPDVRVVFAERAGLLPG